MSLSVKHDVHTNLYAKQIVELQNNDSWRYFASFGCFVTKNGFAYFCRNKSKAKRSVNDLLFY